MVDQLCLEPQPTCFQELDGAVQVYCCSCSLLLVVLSNGHDDCCHQREQSWRICWTICSASLQVQSAESVMPVCCKWGEREVKARIGNAIGPYEDLLTTVKRRKLKWYGHVTRSSGLAKTILQGTVQGGRRRGRQRKRWEDNIKEWTGLPWNITLRKAENREEWRKLVVKSTVVPQRSARLRDR